MAPKVDVDDFIRGLEDGQVSRDFIDANPEVFRSRSKKARRASPSLPKAHTRTGQRPRSNGVWYKRSAKGIAAWLALGAAGYVVQGISWAFRAIGDGLWKLGLWLHRAKWRMR